MNRYPVRTTVYKWVHLVAVHDDLRYGSTLHGVVDVPGYGRGKIMVVGTTGGQVTDVQVAIRRAGDNWY